MPHPNSPLPPADLPGPHPRWSRWLALAAYHRRWIAGACVALAVWSGTSLATSPARDGVDVIVAATDLPAGTRVGEGDLTVVTLPLDTVPDGAVARSDLLGRVLASPLRRGEPLTDARLLTPGLTDHAKGRSVVPLRLGDGDVAQLLRVGDVVDLIAVDARTGSHRSLSAGARVVSVVPPADGAGQDGPLLAMAVLPDDADGVAAAGFSGSVHVVLAAAS